MSQVRWKTLAAVSRYQWDVLANGFAKGRDLNFAMLPNCLGFTQLRRAHIRVRRVMLARKTHACESCHTLNAVRNVEATPNG